MEEGTNAKIRRDHSDQRKRSRERRIGDDLVFHVVKSEDAQNRIHTIANVRHTTPGMGAGRGGGGECSRGGCSHGVGRPMLKSVLIAEEDGERLFELMEVNGCVKYPTGTLIIVRAVESHN